MPTLTSADIFAIMLDMQKYKASLKLVGLLLVLTAIGVIVFAVTSNTL